MNPWKALRVLVLLVILLAVAADHFLGQARLADWSRTKWVTIYPIVADRSATTARYAGSIEASQFDDIGEFLRREAARHGVAVPRPIQVQLAAASDQVPPEPPHDGGRLGVALWSLKMRWWTWRRDATDGLPEPDIQLFILYRDNREGSVLDRSVGVRKGRFGLVNAYASAGMDAQNRVVMAHELLHVLGATDKYELSSGQPSVPDGLGEPERRPLFPQARAEIMGGRIALSPSTARMPASLTECVIGPLTAREIGW